MEDIMNSQWNIMKNTYWKSIFLTLVLLVTGQMTVEAQQVRYAANVTPMVGIPHTMYLEDYSEPGSNHLTANVIFNDFNEPVWDFRLRLTIETNDIVLRTSPNFIPANPISVAPGVPVFLSGDDWAPYLDLRHLDIQGRYRNEFLRSGRLPEGYYNFCIEVLDYTTGRVLSRQSCANAWLQMSSPPVINTPFKGAVIDPSNIQIPITWNLVNTPAPDALMTTQYQLTMWEITGRGADPMSAVSNGQALQVFQSELLNNTMFLYGPSEPALEEGKRYVFRVQAIDPEGRTPYKNDGYSEFVDFYYGNPANGHITLKEPKYNGAFKMRDLPLMKWSSADNIIPGQMVSYKIEIAEIPRDKEPDENTDFATKWYEHETPANARIEDKFHTLDKLPQKEKVYAWMVKSYVDGRETAKSEPFIFNGPGLVERFYAGIHTVFVDVITEANLASLDGEGRVRLTEDPDLWTKVTFKDLVIKEHSGFYVLEGGEFFYEPPEPKRVDLTPDVKVNEYAMFDIQRYRFNKEGISAWGQVTWDFPFPTMSNEKALVQTKEKWVNFNIFKLNGALELGEHKHYDLLDPYQFSVDLDSSSIVYLNDDLFRFDWSGKVNIPSKVKGTLSDQLSLSFLDQKQIYYMHVPTAAMDNKISILQGTRLNLIPKSYTIDFSDTESPTKHSADPDWKGAYFDSYQVEYTHNFDEGRQLKLDDTFYRDYKLANDNTHKAWVSSTGLHFNLEENFEQGSQCYFNTFPVSLRKIRLKIEDNYLMSNCYLNGDMYIPVIDEEKQFEFTVPISAVGFRAGHLVDLENIKSEFNTDKREQRVDVTFKRPVFVDNNRLEMTLDMHWPALDLSLENVRGFKAWGNYSIGFNTKNGSIPLFNRAKCKLREYDADAHTLSAGAGDGIYAFALSLDIQMGDDTSGPDGPPTVNLYSLMPNRHLPDDMTSERESFIDEAQKADDFSKQVDKAEAELKQREEDARLKLAEEAMRMAKLAAQKQSTDGYEADLGEIYDGGQLEMNPAADKLNAGLTDSQAQLVDQLVQRVSEKVTASATGKINELSKKITDKIEGSVDSLYMIQERFINRQIDRVVDSISNVLVRAAQNDVIDLSGAIRGTTDLIKQETKTEINGSFRASLKMNVKDPLTTLVEVDIAGRMNDYIVESTSDLVYGVFRGDPGDIAGAAEGAVAGIPDLFVDIGKDVARKLHPEELANNVYRYAKDGVKGINMGSVASRVAGKLDEVLLDAVGDAVMDYAKDEAMKYANEMIPADVQVSVSFDGMGKLFAGGSAREIFADPLVIEVKTKNIYVYGMVQFHEDEPDYGDVWFGEIKAIITNPFDLNIAVIYLNGKKDGFNYWMAQIDSEVDKKRNIGGPLSKDVKYMGTGISLVPPFHLNGITARFYRRMREAEGSMIYPDRTINYGAYLALGILDTPEEAGSNRLHLSANFVMEASGDFEVELNGDIHLLGKQRVEKAGLSLIEGNINIKYNSAERHFIGRATVEVPSMCAKGYLLVDVKPSFWRVAVGTQEDPVSVDPLCAGIAKAEGWMDLNKEQADLGLNVEVRAQVKTPNFDAALAKFNVEFLYEYMMSGNVIVNFDPIRLQKLSVSLSSTADLSVNYQYITGIKFKRGKIRRKWSSWKRFTVAHVSYGGAVLVEFTESQGRLQGNVYGRVKVMGVGAGFSASLDMKL